MVRSFDLIAFSILFGMLVPAAGLAQEEPEQVRAFGHTGDVFLYGVRAAVSNGTALAVLTDPAPAVHVFTAAEALEWGAAGGGPGELASPVDVEWTGGSIFVLDVGLPKFVRYGDDGAFVSSRPTDGLRARRLWIRGRDTVLATFAPMTDEQAAVRLRGPDADTLFTFEQLGPSIRLEAPGAPSLTVKPPYYAQIQWTVLSDGGIVRFDPEVGHLEWLDRAGHGTANTPLPWKEGLALGDGDREWWIDTAIPDEFMGRPVFEPLRAVARETLDFPPLLPAVLATLEDVEGGVWLRRTTPVRGERWALVGRDGGMRGEIVFPPGRAMLATDRAELFVLARDELGVERVEAYRRPAWAD